MADTTDSSNLMLPAGAYRRLTDRIRIEGALLSLARTRTGDAAMLAAIVFLAAFPLLVLRGYHYEEGLTVAFAKEAMRGERWYDPTLYGFRFVERPVLQSWLIALISWPLGTVTQITARLPTVLAVFSGALLIAGLLRGRASRAALLFAALCFVFSPVVLQKIIVAESEVLLAVTQFAAFVLWWRGVEAGGPSLARWLAVGVLLLATASFKGPQPAAFFALGAGAFILLRRDWRQVPGYCLAGLISLGGLAAWYFSVLRPSDVGMVSNYMRLEFSENLAVYLAQRQDFATIVVQFLPATLVLAPAALDLARRREVDTKAANRSLVLALALFGGLTLIPLALWPGTQPRYAMSALLPAACLAGLVFDGMLRRRLDLARVAITVLAALAAYQLAWGWLIAPSFWRDFAASRIAADTIEAAAPDHGVPIVARVRSADPILAYLDRPISYLTDEGFSTLAAPAYLVARPETAEGLAARRPDLAIAERARLREQQGLVLYEILSRAGS